MILDWRRSSTYPVSVVEEASMGLDGLVTQTLQLRQRITRKTVTKACFFAVVVIVLIICIMYVNHNDGKHKSKSFNAFSMFD